MQKKHMYHKKMKELTTKIGHCTSHFHAYDLSVGVYVLLIILCAY